MKLLFDKLTKLWDIYKKDGVIEVLEKFCTYSPIPNKLFCIRSEYLLKLGHINKRAISRPLKDYEFEFLGRTSLEDILSISMDDKWMTGSRGQYARHFDKDSICFASRHNKKITGYIWGSRDQYVLECYCGYNIKRTIGLQPDTIYLSDMYIAKNYRLKGLYAYLIHYLTERFDNNTKFYTNVSNSNKESLNSAIRLGFVKIQKIIFLTIFGKQLVFSSAKGKHYIGSNSMIDL